MDNLVYQIPHKIMQDLVNHIGNNFTWIQAEPVLKLIRENIKEIDLSVSTEGVEIPTVEGK